ncbi:hypothetical protein J7E25_05625 [Agromyces sp. ISL-38]|uniref:hypothetical protein n=1 Tax=Agromyces sp. ISL-38 TaxID=2819107 RepID=UPI001BE8FC39|nr:hypothetical protein [Agromyces sp. ISL-38]MBT2498568.1 hypothetical protein [Agromyces sp. ISL-38]
MTISQEQFDDLLGRTALAALFYLPEVTVEDGEYRLEEDVSYCMEPVAGIAKADAEKLRDAVARAIADPTGSRSDLLALVLELAPPPPSSE